MPSPSASDLTLVGLPTEVTQIISGFAGGETLLQFRQTCKEMEARTFKQFVAEHVKDQHCWMISKKRWERIEATLASRLGAHMHSVTLMADAIDHLSRDNIPVVERLDPRTLSTNTQEDIVSAKHETASFISEEENRFAEGTDIENFLRFRPDLSTMIKVLRAMNAHDLPVHIDIVVADDVESTVTLSDTEKLFCAISASQVRVGRLNTTYDQFNGLDIFGIHDYKIRFLRATGTMEQFSLSSGDVCTMSSANFCQDNGVGPGLSKASAVLRSARQLKELSLSFVFNRGDRELNVRSCCSTCTLLKANSFRELRLLSLDHTTVHGHILLEALISCTPTLTELRLFGISLVGGRDAWENVLQQVHEMEKLESFTHGAFVTVLQGDLRNWIVHVREGPDEWKGSKWEGTSTKVEGHTAVRNEVHVMLRALRVGVAMG